MPYGYNGKIARINLTTKEISSIEEDWYFYRKYLGGRGFISYFLLNEVPPDADPLGEENKLIIAASVMTGAPLPGFGRQSVGAKSPLTGMYGESEAGGFFGPELKFAGWDALVIEGASETPVYIYIKDGEISINDASGTWRQDTHEAKQLLIEELDEPKIKVLAIGKGGENLVRFSGVASDTSHYHGRTGMGAVMGSKKLKAVAVRGTKKVELYDKEKVQELARWFAKQCRENVDNSNHTKFGTSSYYFNANQTGNLPTRNFQTGCFDRNHDYTVENLHLDYKVHNHSCYACPVRCKQAFSLESPYKVVPEYGAPEFETLASFNSSCGIDDLAAAAKAHELCNRYSMDTVSCGMTIAFAMECFERGVITKEDTGGIDLRFGNAGAMLEMVEKIAAREGFGDTLAEGAKRAAEIIGGDAPQYALHVKGQEFAMAEPRSKFGLGLAFAVSPTGADHIQHEHDGAFDPALTGYSHDADNPIGMLSEIFPLGILQPVPSLSIGPDKVRLFTYFQSFWSLFECIDTCVFTWAPVRTWKVHQMVEMVRAVTGWDTSLWELMKVGERATTMTRCFNLKAGLTAEDDSLPDRVFDPLPEGPLEGSRLKRDEMDDAVHLYYGMMGWDEETGVPSRARLYELDIPWAMG